VSSTLLPRPPSSSPNAVTRPGNLITWWTGNTVMVFDAANLTYRYSIAPAGPSVPVGPATMMAGKLLVPVTDGIAVCDPVTGVGEGFLPVHRDAQRSTVILAVSGSQLLEQRGNTLVALG
jgi:hypothetical protein